ncbi:MAG: hypothetical protein K8R36_02680 [Planctomycetales bacterium]|nr:hypothetical protein [Planctomycetales bacterium]
MIFVGIDDTDTLDTPGTNQLARMLATRLTDRFRCRSIVRHQLFFDPRIPYTSHNGSASLLLEPLGLECAVDLPELITDLRHGMQEAYVEGSDPGLCVAEYVPDEVISYAHRCKREVIDQQEARSLAETHGIHLEGLGGTEGGIIGALAAIGLVATQNDGRIIQWEGWEDDLTGLCELSQIRCRGVEVTELSTGQPILEGAIDIGKKLRPNLRKNRAELFAQRDSSKNDIWQAVRVL